jgi:two-component system chemotaxis response regulator CheY
MPKTILIVDGNEVEREGLAVVLARRGYGVAQAENGQAALDYLKANPKPDVIVTDMMMPVMDGWTFLTRRQKLTAIAAIPTIILTGLGVASQEWARSIGAVACLRKPIEPDDLVKAIEAC